VRRWYHERFYPVLCVYHLFPFTFSSFSTYRLYSFKIKITASQAIVLDISKQSWLSNILSEYTDRLPYRCQFPSG
jgi:hypothetical protein